MGGLTRTGIKSKILRFPNFDFPSRGSKAFTGRTANKYRWLINLVCYLLIIVVLLLLNLL